MKAAVVSLSVLLVLSLLGNVIQFFQVGEATNLAAYTALSFDQERAERAMLRNYAIRLARGERAKDAWLALDGKHAMNGPWLETGPLMARFDGENLVAICSVFHPLGDPCLEGH